MHLEYGPVVTHVCTNGTKARLVTRSTISDTKGDTTTLLVTILQPRTETVLDVWKIPSVLLYLQNWGYFTHMQAVCTRALSRVLVGIIIIFFENGELIVSEFKRITV